MYWFESGFECSCSRRCLRSCSCLCTRVRVCVCVGVCVGVWFRLSLCRCLMLVY